MTSPLALLLTQITFSFAALTVLALRLRGWARTLPEPRVLKGLLWMHVPRAVALGVLAPGQALGVPPAVARSIAWGDFISAALALLAIVALHTDRARATRWVWVFSLVSCADIVGALALGIGVYARPLGVSWLSTPVGKRGNLRASLRERVSCRPHRRRGRTSGGRGELGERDATG